MHTIEQPLDQENGPPAVPSQHLGKFVGATIVVAGLAGGLLHGEVAPDSLQASHVSYGAQVEGTTATHEQDTSTMLSSGQLTISLPLESKSPTPPPAPEAPSPQLVQEFQTVLSHDTCDPITAESAATIYHNSFETNDYPNMTDDELLGRVWLAAQEFQTARSTIEFPQLSPDYQRLLNDATKQYPEIPISEYQSAIGAEFDSVGLSVRFNWKIPIDYQSAMDQHTPPADLSLPYTPEQLDTQQMRQAIVGNMHDLTLIPTAIISLTDRPPIYIANTIGNQAGALAYVQPNNDMANHMVIDLSKYAFGKSQSTLAHESSHELELDMCSKFVDAAWIAENPVGYEYGHSDTDSFGDEQSVPLYKAPLPVVSMKPYGDSNEHEDIATNLGEDLLYAPNADRLYSQGDYSMLIPDKKVSLYIARIANKYPNIANYLQALLKISSLEAAIQSRYDSTEVAYEDKYDGNSKLVPNDIYDSAIPGTPAANDWKGVTKLKNGMVLLKETIAPSDKIPTK